MKQLFLSGKGEISVFDVPLPGPFRNSLLVRTSHSLISAGTESSAVSKNGGWLGVLEKASHSRDKVQQTWQLARKQGFAQTWAQVQGKLDDWTMMGYSASGQVVEVSGESEFRPGDLVACMGTGFANHAEYNVVPANMAVKIPDGVPCDQAAFGAVACIAQQGLRVLELAPGEDIAVIGLGLIGALCALQARAMGYRVYGIDLSPERAAFCREVLGIPAWALGEVDVVAELQRATGGHGVDGVVLCAATKSSDPVNLAFDLCRQKGKVAIVGDIGLELQRAKMYRKEISVRMSCSYGPGRYDSDYEVAGRDYPYGYVRWTERRNLQFYLQSLADHRIDVQPLITRKFELCEGPAAYAALKQQGATNYGVLFAYQGASGVPALSKDRYILRLNQEPTAGRTEGRIRLGVLGCGAFAKGVHLPNLARLKDDFEIAAIASRSGGTAAVVARRFKIPVATSDSRFLLDDPSIDAVLVTTRHAAHAGQVLEALHAGKHVFVEKPMCLTVEEGREIVALSRAKGLAVRVGFNRRYAPYLTRMKQAVGSAGPRILTCRVSINSAQLNHWSNTDDEGGRFLGEGVHFLDLCNWFVDSAPCSVAARALGTPSRMNPNLAVTVRYPDGSLGSVIYTTCGDPGIGKEYYEAFGNGRSARCQDFQRLDVFGARVKPARSERGDKGYLEQLVEFAAAVRGERAGKSAADARAGLLATWMALAALESAETGRDILFADIDPPAVQASAA